MSYNRPGLLNLDTTGAVEITQLAVASAKYLE